MKNIIIPLSLIILFNYPVTFAQTYLNKSNCNNKNLQHCDTLTIDNIYRKINSSKQINFSSITPKIIGHDTITQNKSKVVMTTFDFIDSFNVSYTTNLNYDVFEIRNDRDYITVNNKNIYLDDLYFAKPDTNHTFRSADGINAYSVSFKNSDYLFLFTSYSSGMFSGTCLLVFYKKTTDHTAKFIYFKEQLSEDMSCFGVDSNENKLIYYEWCMTHGKINDYYNIYEISDSVCNKQKTNNLEIKAINPFQIILCK